MDRNFTSAKNVAGLIKSYLDSDQNEGSEELEQWLAESDEHRRFFEHLLDGAHIGENLDFYDSVNVAKEWRLFRRTRRPAARRRLAFRLAGAVAASVLLASGAWFLSYEFKDEETTRLFTGENIRPGEKKAVFAVGDHRIDITEAIDIHNENGTVIVDSEGHRLYYSTPDGTEMSQRITVPRGGEYDLTLGDGTRIWLNSETELTYPVKFDPAYREITIKGKAYLEVAHNPGVPFYVNVDNVRVRVLGTSFVVDNYANEDNITVSLLSGKVCMETLSGSPLAELSPSQQFSLNRETGTAGIGGFDRQSLLDWKNKLFVFKNENLTAIARRLERWYDIEIDIDPSLRNNCYSGIIDRHGSLQPIIFILTNTNEMKIIETAPGKIAIKPK